MSSRVTARNGVCSTCPPNCGRTRMRAAKSSWSRLPGRTAISRMADGSSLATATARSRQTWRNCSSAASWSRTMCWTGCGDTGNLFFQPRAAARPRGRKSGNNPPSSSPARNGSGRPSLTFDCRNCGQEQLCRTAIEHLVCQVDPVCCSNGETSRKSNGRNRHRPWSSSRRILKVCALTIRSSSGCISVCWSRPRSKAYYYNQSGRYGRIISAP